MPVPTSDHRDSIKKIVLGTVQFGLNYGINNQTGKPSAQAVQQILDFAFKAGIRTLDSAEAYGDAHEVIGRYHQNSENRFNIITKFSKEKIRANLHAQVSEDLEKLNVDRLYAYMFHSFADYLAYYEKFAGEIQELKQAGTILKFGVSIYTNEELAQVIAMKNIDIVQLPFNMLDNISKRGALIKKAHEAGIEVHTRSVFLQGLFFKDPGTLPQSLEGLSPYLLNIREIGAGNNSQLTSLALNYVLHQPDIDGVLVGVDTLHQLEENIRSVGELNKETVMRIDDIEVRKPELLNPANWKL